MRRKKKILIKENNTMLNKVLFCEIVTTVQGLDEKWATLDGKLKECGEYEAASSIYQPAVADFRCSFLNLLEFDMRDDAHWIRWWLYETKDRVAHFTNSASKKEERPLPTEADLYDFLAENIDL